MNRLDYILASLRRAGENGYAWSVSPDEAGALVAEVERLRAEAAKERAAERAAVVAWLRARSISIGEDHHNTTDDSVCWAEVALLGAANAIESGEHRREEEE
jgi:hypothetical protein